MLLLFNIQTLGPNLNHQNNIGYVFVKIVLEQKRTRKSTGKKFFVHLQHKPIVKWTSSKNASTAKDHDSIMLAESFADAFCNSIVWFHFELIRSILSNFIQYSKSYQTDLFMLTYYTLIENKWA